MYRKCRTSGKTSYELYWNMMDAANKLIRCYTDREKAHEVQSIELKGTASLQMVSSP